MTFAVIFIALLIERFFDWSHLRRWHWYLNYQQKIASTFSTGPYVVLIISIGILLLAVLLLEWLLKGVWFGAMEWVFQLVVFLYCLGPQNLWADTFACMNAAVQGDEKTSLSSASPALPQPSLGHVFIAANQRIFAVIFWYIILGPMGAVLYRALNLSAAKAAPEGGTALAIANSASTAVTVLDFVPVRLVTCVFALGGHFVEVLSCWRKKEVFGLDANDQLLMECGKAALGQEEMGATQEGAAIKSAINLVDRSLVITLVFAALIILLG